MSTPIPKILKLALTGLRTNKTRTALSVLGIVIGWYPAKKAAKMNVIEALRYE